MSRRRCQCRCRCRCQWVRILTNAKTWQEMPNTVITNYKWQIKAIQGDKVSTAAAAQFLNNTWTTVALTNWNTNSLAHLQRTHFFLCSSLSFAFARKWMAVMSERSLARSRACPNLSMTDKILLLILTRFIIVVVQRLTPAPVSFTFPFVHLALARQTISDHKNANHHQHLNTFVAQRKWVLPYVLHAQKLIAHVQWNRCRASSLYTTFRLLISARNPRYTHIKQWH